VALCLNAVFVGVLAIACARTGARRRYFLLGSLVATAAAYPAAFVVFLTTSERQWEDAREAHSFESISDRLQYEKTKVQTSNMPGTATAVDSNRLDSFEQQLNSTPWKGWLRERSLQLVHADSVEQFIQTSGFGVGRMPLPSPRRVELAEPEPIPLPVKGDGFGEFPSSGDSLPSGAGDPETKRALDLHEDSLQGFFDTRSFGYVQDRDHVAGFQPHAFAHRPGVPRRWLIEKLELVSLLKHEEPAVYLSEHLPRMQELRDAATRPLDSFEKQALSALQNGEDLQVQSSPDRVRMLGSIRAVKQCLKCHSVERGDLLGAFSYDLRREH
jgi:hypothetical protein